MNATMTLVNIGNQPKGLVLQYKTIIKSYINTIATIYLLKA